MSVTTSLGGNPNHIYYNARLDNFEGAGVHTPPIAAVFNDTRPAALINRARDYELSIVRFQMSLQSLPALIVEHPVQAGPTPTNTAYTFTIENTDGSISESATVQWLPAVTGRTQGSGTYQDPYWWEYDYLRFGTFVNAALTQAMAAVIAADESYAAVPAPYFAYDTQLAEWSLYCHETFLDSTGSLQLWANHPAQYLFSGFPETQSTIGISNVRYNIFLQPNESLTSANLVKRTQTPGSLVNWNPVRRIVFTTATLPVVSESINSSTNYTTGQTQSSLASQQIVSDLTPDVLRGDELRAGLINYTPSAEYRYLDLQGEAEIRDINFSVFWEDTLGNLNPHMLWHNDFVSAKLLFHRKS